MIDAAASRVAARDDVEPAPVPGPRLVLSKHEGAGNDFLVLLDPAGDRVRLMRPATVMALCDRHRGVGADGLVMIGPARDGAAVSMTLYNADGSEAAMSGNGIRCLAQAAVDTGLAGAGPFDVATAAGVRRVEYRVTESPGVGWASVDMGRVTVGPEQESPLEGWRARSVDVGNPHLVLLGLGDPASVDLAVLGVGANAASSGGVNVEVVHREAWGALRLRVWERGVGETRACGTGSCAAAAAARRWGVAGGRVMVDNPGGRLIVELGETEEDPVTLSGPVRRVAEVVVDLGVFGTDARRATT